MRILVFIAISASPVVGQCATQGQELAEAEAKWAKQQVESYEFTFAKEMHNYIELTPDVHVVVQGGRVRSVRSAEECCGYKKGEPIPRSRWKLFSLAIADVFDFMRNLLDLDAEGGVIPYHPVYGFPEHVHVEPEDDAHAAATYRVTDFRIIR
jgi:Family of unknown function (DUF6174)